MRYWIFKTEPSEYSIDSLKLDKKTNWTGIRNYQVRNFIKTMSKNDIVLIYHSSIKEPYIAGLAKISKEYFPDPTAFNIKNDYFDPKSKKDKPTWFCVEIKFIKKFKSPIYLKDIKNNKKFKKLKIVQKGNRLSITEINKKDFENLIK